MSVVVAEEPRLLHAISGRIRVQLSWWTGEGQKKLEAAIRQMGGVRSAQANPLTGNVLVAFDPTATNQ